MKLHSCEAGKAAFNTAHILLSNLKHQRCWEQALMLEQQGEQCADFIVARLPPPLWTPPLAVLY